MQSTLAVVSLGTIQKNARAVIRAARRPLIAVIKDDAYGHGAYPVACALADMVSLFAVSTVDEGAELVHAGAAGDALVLTPPLTRDEAFRARALGLIVTISSAPVLRLVLRAGRGVRAHIAVNTGMNRYGFAPDEAGEVCRIAKARGVLVEGAFSHLYAPQDEAARIAQERAFERACLRVKAYFPDALCHLAATGGVAYGGKTFDAVRAGLALYGYAPENAPVPLRVRPAMKVYAYAAQSGTPYGGGVGYAAAEKQYAALHTLRVGYGDGFFRAGGLGAEGKLCMDACVREGEMPFGRRVCVLSDAEAYARSHGTTAYETLVNAGRRALKKYVR